MTDIPPPEPTRNPTLERYGQTVQTFLPGCAGDELLYRCGLLRQRDHATATLQASSPESAAILDIVISLATMHAFAPMAIERLKRIRYEGARLISCAGGVEIALSGACDG